MISRRSFLKISGLTAAALGAGYGSGKLTGNGELRKFSVHGFLPGDTKIISDMVKAFNKKADSYSAPVIYADKNWAKVISKAYTSSTYNRDEMNGGNVTFRMVRLNETVNADILLSDDKISVYNPSLNFNGMFKTLRNRIQNTKAEYLFSAEYSEKDLLSSLFRSHETVAVIENDKGTLDKIKLNASYKNIEVDGAYGKTGIAIENGLVRVHKASCRHQLCKYSGIVSRPGEIIACAPNKVLIKIEIV